MNKIFTSKEALANPPSFWGVANPEWLQTLNVGDVVGCVIEARYGRVVFKFEKVERRSPKRITIGHTVINIEKGREIGGSRLTGESKYYLPCDDNFKSLVIMTRKASEADALFSGLAQKFNKLPNEAKVQIADKIRAIAVEFGVVFEDLPS